MVPLLSRHDTTNASRSFPDQKLYPREYGENGSLLDKDFVHARSEAFTLTNNGDMHEDSFPSLNENLETILAPCRGSRDISPQQDSIGCFKKSTSTFTVRYTQDEDADTSVCDEEMELDTMNKTSVVDGIEVSQKSVLERRNTSCPEPFLEPRRMMRAKSVTTTRQEGGVEVPKKSQKAPVKSPYFSPPVTPSKSLKSNVAEVKLIDTVPNSASRKRPVAGVTSCIPFPPLSAQSFGLIQEQLAHDPFRLLIAVTFLNRTHGKHAIPVFYQLMSEYPSIESLASAPKDDIVKTIYRLGFQNQRASTYQAYAQTFLTNPPVKDKRHRVLDYPTKGCGRDVGPSEIVSDADPRTAWEIGHLTQGRYALDSWRIFCRDELRGLAIGYCGEGAMEEGFQPEWMRVLPDDKELRAFLRWMWLKEGWAWDPVTGDKEVADAEMIHAAADGRIAWDDIGGMRVLEGLRDPDTGEVAVWTQSGGLEYLAREMQVWN